MNRYSASYANTEKNFVFLNMNQKKKIKNHNIYGLICVIQNIIQRGKISRPSDYITKELGPLDDIQDPIYLVSARPHFWNIIKGDDKNVYYPAETFYYRMLPQYLEEYDFVRNLIIPEADFRDVLGFSSALDGQAVDFYLPETRTVVEIDGGSHKKREQILKDNERDRALSKQNINVIRIRTEDIRSDSKEVEEKINRFVYDIKKNEVLKRYYENLNYPSRGYRGSDPGNFLLYENIRYENPYIR